MFDFLAIIETMHGGMAVTERHVLEALVHQGLLQAHPALVGGLVEQGGAGDVVVRGRGQHHDTDDQAQNVHGQPSLTP